MTHSDVFQRNRVYIQKKTGNDGNGSRTPFYEINTKPTRHQKTSKGAVDDQYRTPNDDGMMKAISNHDKIKSAKVAPTPCRAFTKETNRKR